MPHFRRADRSSARGAARATASPSQCAENSLPATISPPSASAHFPDAPLFPPMISRSAPPVAMLSYRAWQQRVWIRPRRLSAAPLILDGHPVTIIGITPPGFFGETLRSDPPEIWIPTAAGADLPRQQLPAAYLPGLAARHRTAEAGRFAECAALPAHQPAARLAGERERHACGMDGRDQSPARRSRTSRSFRPVSESAS